jgi:hypothetical protein
MPATTMKRHEWWRHNYRNVRDLDHLSPEELSERLHDCINNIRTRTSRGKLGLLPVDQPVGETWMTLFTEVLEECNLRGYPYPGPISIAAQRASLDHAFDPIPDVDRVLKEYNLEAKPYLLKFGEPKWLRPSFDFGKFRIASASYYDSDTHNHARRDTELERFIHLNPRNPLRAGIVASHTSQLPSPSGNWASIASPTDYFLFSLSALYSARLFGDFASTACLVIYEPHDFLRRVKDAISARLSGWHIETTYVSYFDPVRVNPGEIVVPKFKPFKHAYQTELRIVCVPPDPIGQLSPFEIEVGSLSDCAAFVDLSSHPSPPLPHDHTEDPIRSFGTTRSESMMVHLLPNVAKMQGIVLNKSAPRHEDWYFEVQYTDNADTWHQFKLPMLDGLYLLNLLQAAEQEQHLGLWNRK